MTATIATSQTTTSNTAYADMATVGPTVTITTPTGGGHALVIINASVTTAFMSFQVSGQTTIAAADTMALVRGGTTNAQDCASYLVTLNAGSNTFTAKYKGNGNTGTVANRSLIVIPY